MSQPKNNSDFSVALMIPAQAAAEDARGCPQLPTAARTLHVPRRRRQQGAGPGGRCAFKTQLPRCQGLGNVCVVLLYTIITLLGVIKHGFVILLRWRLLFPPLNHKRQLRLHGRQWEHPRAGQPCWVHQSSRGSGS